MYKLYKDPIDGQINTVQKTEFSVTMCIPFDPANTDYQQFKQAINDDTAQLEDADGNLMTAEEAKAFVATLP